MASINPSGNFVPKNLGSTGSRNRSAAGDEAGINIQDGLTLSSPVTSGTSEIKLDPSVKSPEEPQAWYDPQAQTLNFKAPEDAKPNADILMFEMGGIGSGLLNASQAVNAPKDGAGVSEFAFTNGLNSTKLLGLSGRTLADLNPLKQ